jgi:phosphoglycolate phosphatase
MTIRNTDRQFDLIAFDWDGTLFDSTQIIVRCIQAAVKDVGGTVPSDKDAGYVIGLGLKQALAHAAPDVPLDKYPLLGERYRHHYELHADDLSLFEGVVPLLAALKARGYLLAVATGKSRHGLDEVLQTVQLKGVFDASRTADKTAGKPAPKMLYELMAELGTTAQRTLMVGDTTHDLQMALNAGCPSIGVSYGAHQASAFAALNPLHVAHSVPDMHDWLLKNG